MKAYIRKSIKSSPVDGPGNRYVVFFQGCNLNCLYCHNPETIAFDKETKAPFETDLDVLFEDIIKRKGFISGVTLSGGECTLQFDALYYLADKLNMAGIDLLIDSNGKLSREQLVKLSDVVAGFMFDMKTYDLKEHIDMTGHGNELILENIEYASRMGKIYELRLVVVPGLINNEVNVGWASDLIVKHGSKASLKLIKYRQHGVRTELINVDSPTDEYMEKLKNIAKNRGVTNIVIL